VSVSYDGLPTVHDRCRLTASGDGSSAQVAHTLRRFDAAKFSYGVRLTVTAEHIPALPDSVDYLRSQFHPISIHLEPVCALGRGAEAACAESDEFIKAYRKAAERAAAHGRTLHFSGARAGTLTNHFCGVSQDSFAPSADGKVTSCFEVIGEDSAWAGAFLTHGAAHERRVPCRSPGGVGGGSGHDSRLSSSRDPGFPDAGRIERSHRHRKALRVPAAGRIPRMRGLPAAGSARCNGGCLAASSLRPARSQHSTAR